MKKLYAGLAAAAMTATGIACTAGAAHATGSPWPSDLGYHANTTSTAVASDGTVYVASTDQDDPAAVHVTATDSAGVTTPRTVTLATDANFVVDNVWQVAVASSGAVVVAGEETDDADSISYNKLWVVAPDASTGTQVPGGGVGGEALALSANGAYGVSVGGGQAQLFSLSDGSVSTGAAASLDGGDGASAGATAAAVTDTGNAYVVGTDAPTPDAEMAPTLWTLNRSAETMTTQPLTATPDSVALLGTGAVAVGETDNDGNNSLEFVGGTNDGKTLALAHNADGLATDGQTLWASGSGGEIQTVDLSAVDSYTTTNPVPSYYGSLDSVSGLALGAAPSALYAVGQTWISDDSPEGGYDTNSELYQFTKPGTISSPSTIDLGNGLVCVDFTEATTPANALLSYVVTATDRTSHQPITVMGWSNGDGTGEGCFSDDNGDGLLDVSHAYDFTVTADNGGMLGDAADGGSLLPAFTAGTAAISGTPQVGSTLTATTSGWPAGTKLTYEWDTITSGGEYGGPTPIAGATQSTLTVTPALAGQRIVVGVTGHLDDNHADVTAWSPIVTVVAATPAQQPVQVTKIKPATIKPSAKKVKLTLPGIDVAKAPGKVKVYDGKKLVGTAKIVNGKLVVKFKQHLGHGQHKLKLSYKGSAQVAAFHKKVKIKVK
jgi:hypothetical protein